MKILAQVFGDDLTPLTVGSKACHHYYLPFVSNIRKEEVWKQRMREGDEKEVTSVLG